VGSLNVIALRAAELTKVYKKSKQPALDRLDLEIESGQIFTMLGRNGAGKTTFLRIASTQLMPTSGTISVLGLDAVRQAKELRGRIAVTPQEAETIYGLTGRDHIMLNLRMRGMRKDEAARRTQETIEALELSEAADINTDWLSGGMKQRVIVAMALATRAELVFLDEPTIGLDPLNRRKVWDQLTLLRKEGRTIVLTTHYMDEAEALSDRLVIINRGKVVASGTPRSVKEAFTSRSARVDVFDSFTQRDLERFGHVVTIAGRYRVLTDAEGARKLGEEAVARGANFASGPVTLDDVFVDIVGEDQKRDDHEDR
jgi:ABC-2 type transport system ATP-binding protein